MTTLTFQTPDEARAWDMYVAGALACPIVPDNGPIDLADAMLLERRKRMAPEKVEREWIPHKPGDPMPCGGETLVEVKRFVPEDMFQGRAITFNWSGTASITAWRPA